ncbi:MAG: L-threonylcarbamoyladenylate synthase, partial [Bdellovibrionota bacterium]
MPAKILQPTDKNINLIAKALLRGEVAAIPTETVYGLGGGVFIKDAISRIFGAKERPTFDPLIVHVSSELSDFTALEKIGLIESSHIPVAAARAAEKLMDHFWPGPLTIVLPKSQKVPDLVTSGLPTVAIRMPSHPVAQTLLHRVVMPLAAPSANRFGRISPTCAADVLSELGEKIEFILDGGKSSIAIESTNV